MLVPVSYARTKRRRISGNTRWQLLKPRQLLHETPFHRFTLTFIFISSTVLLYHAFCSRSSFLPSPTRLFQRSTLGSIVPTCAAWGSAKWDYQRPLKTVDQPAGPIMPFKRKFRIVCCMGAWQLSWAWLCHWNRSDLIKPLDGWLFRIGWLCPAWNFRKFLHDIVWFSSPLQIDIAFVMVTTDHRLTSRWPESILWPLVPDWPH